MQQISWLKSMEMGNQEIDEQHKALVELLNRLAAPGAMTDRRAVTAAARGARVLMIEHDEAEYVWMRSVGYPDSVFHASLHADVLAIGRIWFDRIEIDWRPHYGPSTYSVLLEGCIRHIFDEDFRVREFTETGILPRRIEYRVPEWERLSRFTFDRLPPLSVAADA